jgi:hypothetical protein
MVLLGVEGIVDPDGPRGSSLASWTPLWLFLGVLAVLLVVLFIRGRAPDRRGLDAALLRVPRALERRTGLPGWAAISVLFAVYGLAVAGYGFYTDVAWHVALGRDDDLFTAPHTAIFIGLVLISIAPMLGVLIASIERVETDLRFGGLRVPWSMLPLGALGAAALIGFPVDELWHRAYGIDVTMWSPPHLIMILAASFTGLASWLVLAETGVGPGDGSTASHRRWSRGLHVVAGALTLQGLSSVQGEFSYGVPQWQQLFHPVLICIAAGLALTLIRIVHGPGWSLGIAVALFAFGATGTDGPIETRAGAIYLGSAALVEIAALVAGTRDRLRFALVSGVLVATGGLAVEWWWNQGAHQPWTSALFPDALLVGLLAAVAAAVVGAAVAGVVSAESPVRRVPAGAVAVALVALFLALAIPSPRRTGEVTADVRFAWVDEQHAHVTVALDPPDAAEGARWFTAGSWQWGGRQIVHLQPVDGVAGEYTTDEPLLLAGRAKSLVRLHRGAEMMAVAVRLPADEEYGLPAVPAQDRRARFVSEQRYLQREASPEMGWLAIVVLSSAWIGSVALAGAKISGRRRSVVESADELEDAQRR